MYLRLASIVAAATIVLATSPAMADRARGGGIYVGEGGIPRGEHRLRDARHNDNDRDSYRMPMPNTRHRLNDRGRGADYWGPSARPWTHWNNSWGDPNRYARQWGFANYDPRRGWQHGNVWYATPSAWSQWGGWAWSSSVSSGYHYDNYDDRYARNCNTYRSRDWVKGHRATITYYGCADAYGRVTEQPGTRRIERWGW